MGKLLPGRSLNGTTIPGVDETSRANGSRYGGVQSYWLAEAKELTASKPKFREINLELKKNVVLIYTTNDLLKDSSALDGFIKKVAPKEIAFKVDDAILNGVGAGMPLGILNANCTIEVGKEENQAANTILSQNIMNMIGRTLGPLSNYVWLYNKSCLPQIYSLSLAVGTGGGPLFVSTEDKLMGIPLIEAEQCQALGTKGDLILADLSNGYLVADKNDIRQDVSMHVRFIYNESIFRFIYRVDGQPVRATALTPFKGTDTQSHFIALETRG